MKQFAGERGRHDRRLIDQRKHTVFETPDDRFLSMRRLNAQLRRLLAQERRESLEELLECAAIASAHLRHKAVITPVARSQLGLQCPLTVKNGLRRYTE